MQNADLVYFTRVPFSRADFKIDRIHDRCKIQRRAQTLFVRREREKRRRHREEGQMQRRKIHRAGKEKKEKGRKGI